MAEQAVTSALQAVAINPNYADFMRSMEQCWPELRRIALPTVTIRNENVTSTQTSQDAITIPHVNPQSEQPGHSRTVTVERSRSPSRSSQKGGGESRPASRKRNDPSPTKKSAQQPLTARDSPSSKPPPDKKISNEKATTSKTPNQTKSKCRKHPCFPHPSHNQTQQANNKDCRSHHPRSLQHASRWLNERLLSLLHQDSHKRSKLWVIKAPLNLSELSRR